MFPKITPLIPVRRRDLFEEAEWLYELKHDGFRAVAYIGEGRCRYKRHRKRKLRVALGPLSHPKFRSSVEAPEYAEAVGGRALAGVIDTDEMLLPHASALGTLK